MPWRTTAGGSWRERLQEGPGLCGSRMWFLLRAGGPASLEHCLLLVSLFFLGQTRFPCPISLQRGDTSPRISPTKLRGHPAFSSLRLGWTFE